MERVTWTDNRLQDRFDSIDRRFDEVDRKFEAVDRRFEAMDRRFEAMDRRFDLVEGQIVDLRREMREEIGALRTTLNRVGGGTMVGLVGVIAAVFLNGGG